MNSIGSTAIIGMSGRFPGADTLEQFWENLCAGTSGIRDFTEQELREAGVRDSELNSPNYVKSGVILEDIDQ
jgi:acyl transferase domain-containing protein